MQLKAFILFFLGIIQSLLSNSQDTIIVKPLQAGSNDILKVIFVSENFLLATANKLDGGLYIFNKKGSVFAKDIVLNKNGDGWQTDISIPDTCVAIVLNIINPTTQEIQKATALRIENKSNDPFKSGYNIMALIYSGVFKSYLGVDKNVTQREKYLKLFFDQVKDSLNDFPSLFDYYTYKKDTAQLLKLIDSIIRRNEASEYVLAYAVSVAKGTLKLNALGDSLITLRQMRYPRGEWMKSKMANAASSEKNTEAQIELLENFRSLFPEEVDSKSSYIRTIMSSISSNYASEGNLPSALKFIPIGIDTELLTKNYNEIARKAYLKNTYTRDALNLSKKSLEMIDSLKISLAGKPHFLTNINYKKRLSEHYGSFSHTYACLLFRTGYYKKAFDFAKIALKRMTKPDVEIVRDYHMIMAKNASSKDVSASLLSYVTKGIYDSTMVIQFKQINKNHKKKLQQLEHLIQNDANFQKVNILATMVNEPAINFSLFDLNGNITSLDSLKGKIVILDFWATWCVPCLASFPAMQQIVDKYKSDTNIVLLFIDTWESVEKKKQKVVDYIQSTKFQFKILLDLENKVSKSYNVPSLPTKFIIDSNGRIRFTIVDYNGSTNETVKEIEQMIGIIQNK